MGRVGEIEVSQGRKRPESTVTMLAHYKTLDERRSLAWCTGLRGSGAAHDSLSESRHPRWYKACSCSLPPAL